MSKLRDITDDDVFAATTLTRQQIFDMLPDYVRLSGSRAKGTATDKSDYDFYVPERHWQSFMKWARENIGNDFNSCITGHISYRLSYDPQDLLEFSWLFPRSTKKVSDL